MKHVFLDAGHGGQDPGATKGTRKEKDDVLKLVLQVGRLLENTGLRVSYSRQGDVYDSPRTKANKANESKADFFVSCHRNAGGGNGVEALLYNTEGKKKEVAAEICRRDAAIGFVNRGVKIRKELAVLKYTVMPAVLLEIGFIDSDKDNILFDIKFETISREIANGILMFFGNSAISAPADSGGWREVQGRFWYRYSDGGYAHNGWKEIEGKWYLFDKEGWRMTGWQKWNEKWYYLFPENGIMMTGFLLLGGRTFYLKADGSMLTESMVIRPDENGVL